MTVYKLLSPLYLAVIEEDIDPPYKLELPFSAQVISWLFRTKFSSIHVLIVRGRYGLFLIIFFKKIFR